MKFTDAKVKALKPKEERYEEWEANGRGFGVRVSPKSRKSWIYMYRFKGASRRMTLGKFPAMTLAEAHAEHAEAKKKLDKGIDPGLERVNSNRHGRDASTIKGLVKEYIEKRSKNNKGWKEEKRILEKDIVPKWGNRKAEDIKRRDVILILDQIVDRGSPVMANRTLSALRRMFNFAIGRDIVRGSPCHPIERPGGKEEERDRHLNENETELFWLRLKDCAMTEGTKLALKFLLVTLQRKSEVAKAEWPEFDLESNWWTIPKEKTKNGLSHRVYLTQWARDLLSEIKALSGDSSFLFPSPRGGGRKPITTRSLSQALRKNQDVFGFDEAFAPHDLRRTASSHMTRNGIPREIVRKIINHREPGITKVYDRYGYDREKKNAMNKWDRVLRNILSREKTKIVNI